MALVVLAGTWDGDRMVFDDEFVNLRLRMAGFGDGERVAIRVESEPEAKRHHQLKWYWGFILPQLAENGEPETVWDDRLRELFLPPGVETLSLTSFEQMADYNLRCEQYAAEVVGVVIQGPEEARRFAA